MVANLPEMEEGPDAPQASLGKAPELMGPSWESRKVDDGVRKGREEGEIGGRMEYAKVLLLK